MYSNVEGSQVMISKVRANQNAKNKNRNLL